MKQFFSQFLRFTSPLELLVGLVLLAAGIGAIFTGSPWAGGFLVMIAVYVLGV